MPKLTPDQYRDSGGVRCPNCGSENIEGQGVEVDQGSCYQPCGCNDCDAEWNDVYQLLGYDDLEVPNAEEEEEEEDDDDPDDAG